MVTHFSRHWLAWVHTVRKLGAVGPARRMYTLYGLLALILTVAAGCASSLNGPGRIRLSATEFNFGTVPTDAPVSQGFQVRNVGKGWLEITGISTSCGCTTAGSPADGWPPARQRSCG